MNLPSPRCKLVEVFPLLILPDEVASHLGTAKPESHAADMKLDLVFFVKR